MALVYRDVTRHLKKKTQSGERYSSPAIDKSAEAAKGETAGEKNTQVVKNQQIITFVTFFSWTNSFGWQSPKQVSHMVPFRTHYASLPSAGRCRSLTPETKPFRSNGIGAFSSPKTTIWCVELVKERSRQFFVWILVGYIFFFREFDAYSWGVFTSIVPGLIIHEEDIGWSASERWGVKDWKCREFDIFNK